MSGSKSSDFDNDSVGNDFEQIDSFEKDLHDGPPISKEVRQEILTMPQDEKSAYLFGAVNQTEFYNFLKQNSQFKVVSKFQQSGPGGFLPMSDPGVCSFMSRDFAQAVIEGRFKTWMEKISSLDKAFIERLREGQYANMKEIKLGVKDRQFGPAHEIRVKGDVLPLPLGQFDAKDLATNIHDNMEASAEAKSLLNMPCIELRVSLVRLGFAGRFIKPFSHSMMFTPAVGEEGQIDKEHLFFMDANCGIIKIPNNPVSIESFLGGLNSKLFNSMKIRQSELCKYKHIFLSESDYLKRMELINKLLKSPHNEQDYALCKLCRLDSFLQGQIARLECKSISERLLGKKDEVRESKFKLLYDLRTHLHQEWNESSDKSPKFKTKLFRDILVELDKNIFLLEQQRGTIQSKLATTAAEFKKFKEQFSTQDNSESPDQRPDNPSTKLSPK